jgi:hypothetical protein
MTAPKQARPAPKQAPPALATEGDGLHRAGDIIAGKYRVDRVAAETRS